MGIGRQVEKDRRRVAARPLNRGHENTLIIRLHHFDPPTKVHGLIRQGSHNIGHAVRAIDFRFARAKHVQVGSEDNQHVNHSCRLPLCHAALSESNFNDAKRTKIGTHMITG